MSDEVILKKSSPFDPEISELIQELDRYQADLYPPESNHLDALQLLAQPNCNLIAAYKADKIVGIGAAKIMENEGELKRFFVRPSFRGHGIAECIVATLEKWLLDNDVRTIRLETGIRQPEALRFYQK